MGDKPGYKANWQINRREIWERLLEQMTVYNGKRTDPRNDARKEMFLESCK